MCFTPALFGVAQILEYYFNGLSENTQQCLLRFPSKLSFIGS